VVGVQNCPAVRACPTCGLLIEHTSACKQMVCPCSQKFCFICLKTADARGNYQCGTYNFKCEVSPLQTTMPGDDWCFSLDKPVLTMSTGSSDQDQ
jgi:hypothetical protein